VTFWGAAQSVTGSMHLLEAGTFRLLLDCGSAVPPRPGVFDSFPVAAGDLDAVVLSHTHIDHIGALPELVRRGFRGPVYATAPTCDLLPLMLGDAVRHQNPAGLSDLDRLLSQCVPVRYDADVPLTPNVSLRMVDAGHVLGSALSRLTVRGDGHTVSVTYTGDVGRRGLPFLPPPQPIPAADLVICESTYGGRSHPPLERVAQTMAEVVERTLRRGGKVLIPAFSFGRSQVVVHFLQRWMADGRLPRAPLVVDSPLARAVMEVYRRHPDRLLPAALPWLRGELAPVHYVQSLEESQQVSTQREPCILVASGGMCDTGRILEHLRHNVDDPRCTVVLVSYQSPMSLGRRLLEKGPTVVFDGRRWNKWAEVVDLSGFSSHADHDELLGLLTPLHERAGYVRLVHGDVANAEQLAAALRGRGFADVAVPLRGEAVAL
jgi:metallo-beta-lactamase family protein